MTEFSDRVVTIGSEKILPVAAIYGANASGKSNIYNAFEYMSDYVAESFRYGGEEEKFEQFRPTPFLFDSTSAEAESSFEVYFTLPGDKAEKTYNYGFCINKEGVTEEWLNVKAKTARKYNTVFYRGTSGEELDLSGFPKSSRDNIQVALEKQVLIISLGAKLKVGKCKDIREWFLANEFADFVDEDGVRIRKDESYEKNYMIGKYGAIHVLKALNIFKDALVQVSEETGLSPQKKEDVLKNLNVTVNKGDFTVVMGNSGSGKSTLLYALSGMDRPTLGSITYDGEGGKYVYLFFLDNTTTLQYNIPKLVCITR